MAQVVSATYARDNFGEILNLISYTGEDFVVKRQGKVVARVIPAGTVNRKKAQKKKLTGLEFLQELANWHVKGLPRDLASNIDKYAWE